MPTSIMIIRNIVFFSICFNLGFTLTTQSRERHDPTISECAAKGGECDETRGRPVCGTDDQTYPTRCHLLRAQCSGYQVSLKYRGPCKACKEARDYALKHKTKNPPKFIPRCKTDGTYAAIQCLGDTGCWCSDITGKPIENTSVRNGKPKCRDLNRSNIRRSPARHLSLNQNRRSCTKADHATFNRNLVMVFYSEYMRSGQHILDFAAGKIGGPSNRPLPPTGELVLDWKFAHCDSNSNQILDKNEFRELKKLIKRAVKPRRCGRAFGKFCDTDNDDRLSRDEWNSCLSKDGIDHHPANDHNINAVSNDPHRYAQHNNSNTRPTLLSNYHQTHSNNHQNTFHSISNKNTIHHGQSTLDESEQSESNGESGQHLDYNEDNDYDSEEGDDDDSISMINTFGSSTNFPSIYFLRPNPESPLKESEHESDCLADRAAAIEEQRNGGTILYVPECTADGRYQRVQCYHSTPYCWCAHEDSGKNIPGTSVKNQRPLCDLVYAILRPLKGCPEPRKAIFLKDLKEFLKLQILSNANLGANTTKWNSDDERIATLSFVLLDKNKNKAWERKEWKIFRELVTSSKTLRKCGKKMPRYCDVNNDKKITLSEWLDCLQAQRLEVETPNKPTQTAGESATSKPSKLTGSNPLEQYLKD